MEEFNVFDMESRDKAIASLTAAMIMGSVHVTIEPEATRTLPQNSSLHLYCTMLADALNAAGWDMVKTLSLKPDVDVPWSMTSVKNELWRPIQQAVIDKQSTARMQKKDVSTIYEILNRHTSSKLGVSVIWPDRYSQSLGQNQ